MFWIYGIAVIFYFQVWGNSENSKKTKVLNKDEIKKQLIDSIIINNAIEIDNLNELAEKVQRPEDAANIIKQYEEILRTKRIGIIFVAYYQGKLFELFKEKEKFIQMVSQWKIDKSTIIFQMSIFKLIQKPSKQMKSLVTLTFLKNQLKYIKEICEENSSEFE